MKLNIDSSATRRFTEQLKKLPKTAIAIAVKETLNKAAFDVKLVTMPKESKKKFVNRRQNFFKANSKAEGQKRLGPIGSMKSTVGFYENKLSIKTTNFAVKDLEQQERGGNIDGKSFIPLKQARKGGVNNGDIRPNSRLTNIRKKAKIVPSNKIKGKNHKQRIIVGAVLAGKGGFFITGEKRTMFRVDSLSRANKKLKFKITPLYSYKKGRSVSVKKTNFMKQSSLTSAHKMEMWYIAAAEKQIKYWANKAK